MQNIEYFFGKNLHKFELKELNCDYYINNQFEPIVEVNNYTGKVAYKLGYSKHYTIIVTLINQILI